MSEPELTADVARQLFGRKELPEPDSQTDSTSASKPAEPATPAEAQTPATPTEPELSADQLELATRYGLSAQDAKRVRGEIWTEKCEDAERLAALAKPGVNEGEIAALAARQALGAALRWRYMSRNPAPDTESNRVSSRCALGLRAPPPSSRRRPRVGVPSLPLLEVPAN